MTSSAELTAAALDAALVWRAHRRACPPCRMAEMGLSNECSQGVELRRAFLRANRANHPARTA